jgi:hypothetical protein
MPIINMPYITEGPCKLFLNKDGCLPIKVTSMIRLSFRIVMCKLPLRGTGDCYTAEHWGMLANL